MFTLKTLRIAMALEKKRILFKNKINKHKIGLAIHESSVYLHKFDIVNRMSQKKKMKKKNNETKPKMKTHRFDGIFW